MISDRFRFNGQSLHKQAAASRFTIEVSWPGLQCIVCLATSDLTVEHLIPESLGGRLTSRLLCRACNSRIGHQAEGRAKADPTIRSLVAKLAPAIPKLAVQFAEGQRYVSSGPGGVSPGYVKGGEFLVRSTRLDDGSLIQPTPQAAKTLQQLLVRENHAAVDIARALQRFTDAPENTRVEIAPRIEVVKWRIEGIQPALDGPLLNLLVPIKSAYEFLALHLNTAICADAPGLRAIRAALRGSPIDLAHITVERLQAPEAKPFHGLLFEGNNPWATVQVRYFGQLAFRIHFRTLSVDGPRFVYTHNLESNDEHVATSTDPVEP
ncbi:HNH endonuclease [Variovorax robiniae]|uniref:HNH endonuclease n=1 Tax=Variovorax robiniae TaxID=1836199 RepID=A0ABU8X828_9BURK